MEDRYTLFFQKGSDQVLNSFMEWGIVCCSVPFKAGGKTKALEATSLPDEHGEAVAFPKNLIFEPYDAEFEFAYKGEELATNPFNLHLAFEKISAFKKWLSGNDTAEGSGTELKIYSPFATIGRQGCYLLEIGDEDPVVQTKQSGYNLYHENVVTFKVIFRVTDPMTDIVLDDAIIPYQGDVTGSSPALPQRGLHGDRITLSPNYPAIGSPYEEGDVIGKIFMKVSGEQAASWHDLYVVFIGSSVSVADVPPQSSENANIGITIIRGGSVTMNVPGYVDEIDAILLNY